MGEIRSTMDIIMEKTKNLSMTDEEKKAFKRQETEGKIKGLIQKYVDGQVGIEKLKEDIADLRIQDQEELQKTIRKEAIALIQPGESNAPLLEILSSVVDVDINPIMKLLDDFDSKVEHERAERERVLREELRKKGIRGSAVMPNLDADEAWGKVQSETQDVLRQELHFLS